MPGLDMNRANINQSSPENRRLEGVAARAARTQSKHTPVKKDKFQTCPPKTVETAHSTSLNKKEFLKRILKDTKSICWAKEMSILNKLLKIFPDQLFWQSINLTFKLNSSCWLLSDDGRKFLNTEYKKFIFQLPSIKNFDILKEETQVFPKTEKSSLDPGKNIKNFLNLW